MPEDNAKQINQAISDCLARCYDNSMPLGVLAEFLLKLRRDPVWNEAAIETVEEGVLHMLAKLSECSVEDSPVF